MVVRDRDTWRKYAYALGLWLNFLDDGHEILPGDGHEVARWRT
jgi:hypothetical protein